MKWQGSSKLFKAIFSPTEQANSSLGSPLPLIAFIKCRSPLIQNQHLLILLPTLYCRMSQGQDQENDK